MMPAESSRPSLKSRMVGLAGPLGLYELAWRTTRARPRIFMYHRFAREDEGHRLGRESLRAHIRLLRRRCRIVTMGELAEILQNDPAAAAGLAVITVDDGYRDFHEHAWPVLREEGAPATFFPVTGFVDRETWLWPDLVEAALDAASGRSVSAAELGLPQEGSWILAEPAARRAAWQAVIDYAIDLPDADKWNLLRALHEGLGQPWPDAPPPDYAAVSWEQLRELADGGVEIGAHTRTHCRLTRVDDQQIVDELDGAKRRLEEQLQREVRSFCYPNGSPADYDERARAAVERAGYRSAVAAHFDGLQGGLYDLRRHGAGADLVQFRKHLCGIEDYSMAVAAGSWRPLWAKAQ